MNKAELATQTIILRILNKLSTGTRLPSSRAIARSLGIGRGCVSAALGILEEKGRIARSGRGYKATGVPATLVLSQEELQCGPLVPNNIAKRIRESIIQWGSSRAQLPGISEWASILNCGRRGVRQALTLLEAEGLVVRAGRRWGRNREQTAAVSTRWRVFLACSPRAVTSQDYFHFAFIGAVEQELSWRGWGALQTYLSEHPEPREQPLIGRASGLIHLSYGYTPDWPAFFMEHRRVPLVIADFTEQQYRWSLDKHKALRAIFRPDNRKAALLSGLHLRDTGHLSCAFIAPHNGQQHRWVQLRYEGLSGAFTNNPPLYFEAPVSVQDLNTVYDQAAALVQKDTGRAAIPKSLASRLGSSLYDAANLARQIRAFRGIFEKLREMKQVTAWVCATDVIAVLAYDYLRKSKMENPRGISVVGFDNSPLSYHERITSYDFGYHVMGRLCVEALAKGTTFSKRTGTITVDGTLIVRQSSSRRS